MSLGVTLKQFHVALAIFAYNRPDHLKNCLTSLELNAGLNSLDVHIFIDGPLNADAKKSSVEVLRVANDFALSHPSCIISYSKVNLGLRQSVITALTGLFSRYEATIVVEDDLIVSRDFVPFMIGALNTFANDKMVGSISGFAEARFPFFVRSDLIAAKRQSCWGWATWNDRWNSINWVDSNANTNTYFNNVKLLSSIGWDLKQIYKAQIAGEISSWAINFDLHAAQNQWRSLQPRHTLVQNNGMDGSGTHFTLKTKNIKSSIVGKFSMNVSVDSYSSSKFFDFSLRIRHSSFINVLERIFSFIRLRLSS